MRVCGALLILSLSLCGDTTEILLKLSRDDQMTLNIPEHHEDQVTLNFNGKKVTVKDNADSQLVRDNLANLTEHYGDLESRYNELQTKFDQLQSRYNETTEHKDQLQSSLDQLQSKSTTEQLQASLDQLQSRCNKMTEQLQSSLEQQKISHNKLKEERDRLQSSYQQLDSRCNPVTVNPRVLCESDGFTWDGAVCYYLSTEKKSWAESKQYCKDKQADLIFINNHDKQDLVDRVAPSFHGLWIGLTDRDTEGSFKWVNGKPLTSPTFWGPDQPGRDRKGDFDCVYYYNGGVSYRGWFDTYCSLPLPWMCERFVQ